MNSAPAPIPPLALFALTIGVLLAHAVVVQNTVEAMATASPTGPRVLVTRTVHLPAPLPAAPAPAPVVPARKVPVAPRKGEMAAAPPGTASERQPPVRTAEPALVPQAVPAPEPEPEGADTLAQAPGSAASAPETASPPPDRLAIRPPDSAPASASAPVEPTIAPADPKASAALPAPPPAREATPDTRLYAVPASTRLKFDATGMRGKLRYHANGELAWLHDGNNYEARLQLSAFLVGARVLTSTGALTPAGLAPKRYGDKYRSETAAHFERDRGRVVFSANTPEAMLLPGAQDQLSVFVQLAAMLAGEPQRYPPGSTISMQTVGTRIAEPWTFTIDAAETLALPGGEQQALRLTRLPRREYDQKVEIWLAPALAYLPARIRITQSNGDFIDQQWRGTETP